MPVQSCLKVSKEQCEQTRDVDPGLLAALHKFVVTLSDGSKLGFYPMHGDEHKNSRSQVPTFVIASSQSFGEFQGRKGNWFLWGFHSNGVAMNHVELKASHDQQLAAYKAAAAIGVGLNGCLPYAPRK